MQDSTIPGPLAARAIALSPSLELRVAPVANGHTGQVAALDLRLYRRVTPPIAAGFAATSAGLRLPLAAVPHLVAALQSSVEELLPSRGVAP